MEPRKDYIKWPELFMRMAHLVAERSKDPSTQVGAVIVNKDNIVVGMGYNGMPIIIGKNGAHPNMTNDELFPWASTGEYLDTKYPYVCHAELNAVLNTLDRSQLKGATLFCTLAPCNECMKIINQAGITTVVYQDGKYNDRDFTIAAFKLAERTGIRIVSYYDYI